MAIYAPKTAFQYDLTVALTVADGNPILVHGMVFGMDGIGQTATATVTDNDDVEITALPLSTNNTMNIDISFVASNVIKVIATGNNPDTAYVTVLYEGSG